MNLQSIDLELDALDDRERELPERDRYEKLAAEVKTSEKALAAKEEVLHKERAVQKRYEDKLDALTEKIEREQKKLYSGVVTIPKELTGIQQEIESLKERRDEEETVLLEQLDVVEPIEKEIAVLAERLVSMRAGTEEAKSAYAAVSAEITAARRERKEKREAVLPGVEKGHLELYEKTRKRYRRAVVNLKDGVCQGCHTDIPAVELRKILEAPGLSKCPNCGRIVVKSSK